MPRLTLDLTSPEAPVTLNNGLGLPTDIGSFKTWRNLKAIEKAGGFSSTTELSVSMPRSTPKAYGLLRDLCEQQVGIVLPQQYGPEKAADLTPEYVDPSVRKDMADKLACHFGLQQMKVPAADWTTEMLAVWAFSASTIVFNNGSEFV